MTLDINQIRQKFPALSCSAVFFDTPGGTQICQHALDRINHYLVETNANHGGAFSTSRESDAMVEATRAAAADFLNAARPEEIVFGPNMTTLTYNISRALGRTFKPGDTIVVTHLDHDANISPWLQVAEDRGCRVRWVDFNPEDCTLNLEDFQKAMEEKPRLVALTHASNAVGTITPVSRLVRTAHEAGALVYVDAVQFAPHGPIDVQKLGVDFLVCSSYKYFGPHLGVLYGRYELLDNLQAYKVRPADPLPPAKFETGTATFENIAGLLGTLEYLEWVGQTFGQEHFELYREDYSGRRCNFKQAMSAIRSYEYEINRSMLDYLAEVPGLQLFGISDPRRLDERVPTFSFTMRGWAPEQIAGQLARRGIHAWDGNFYALAVTTRLGLEGKGGLIRVGAAHYHTLDEVHRVGEALLDLSKGFSRTDPECRDQ